MRLPDHESVSIDKGHFSELLAFSGLVFHICLGFSTNPFEAEELYQEVYLKAWSRIGSLRTRNSKKYWLVKIARNTSLNYLRKKKMDQGLISKNRTSMVNLETPETAMLKQEQLLALKEAVRHLAGRYQEVFVLREYGELSYAEISKALGIRVGTVMSRLNRARKKLRHDLADYLRRGS